MIICQDLLCNRKAYLLRSSLDSQVIGFTLALAALGSYSSSERHIMFTNLQPATSSMQPTAGQWIITIFWQMYQSREISDEISAGQ